MCLYGRLRWPFLVPSPCHDCRSVGRFTWTAQQLPSAGLGTRPTTPHWWYVSHLAAWLCDGLEEAMTGCCVMSYCAMVWHGASATPLPTWRWGGDSPEKRTVLRKVLKAYGFCRLCSFPSFVCRDLKCTLQTMQRYWRAGCPSTSSSLHLGLLL